MTILGLICASICQAQKKVSISKTEILILKDTIYAPARDTVITLDRGRKFKIRKNPYKTSQDFYMKMKEKTDDNRVTAQLFSLLYVNRDLAAEHATTREKRSSNVPFLPYEGLEISGFEIKHVDILEGSVGDTSRIASTQIGQLANRFHVKTWDNIVRNNLIVSKGEIINSYKLADNERILRRLRFVEDAKIYVNPTSEQSAELIIVIKDRLSWGFDSEVRDFDSYAVELFNRNIGGWGKYVSATWFYNADTNPRHGYEVKVGAQNLNKMITSWELNHINHADRESWGVSLQKEFLAYDISYGGGLDIRIISDSTIFLDGERMNDRFYQLEYQDLWFGRAFHLPFKEKRANLIFTGRFLRHQFNKRPEVRFDSNSIYYNRKMILSEVNLSNQKFIKSNYVLSFGISEDIPIGYRYALILGQDFNEFHKQNYFGFQLFWSSYFTRLGYLFVNHEAGTFKHAGTTEGVTRTELNYFSPIFQLARYRIRNFLNAGFTTGIDQKPEKVISLEERIRDIGGMNISGNSIFSLTIESVFFTPWYFYGFRFAPFGFYSIGEVRDSREQLGINYGYNTVGGGIRIKNESLVFNTFEIRISYFAAAPPDLKPIQIAFKLSSPFSFDNIFRYKPHLIPFR